MRVCFVSVPYDLGRYNTGHGLGPRKLTSSGLDRLLSEAGHNVDSKTIVCGDADELTDIQLTFKLNELLSDAVSGIAQSGTLPIVLAGNCITSAGTLSGLHNPDIRVLWLDAHADFNTPETTTSGYLDGMALSVACGRCWKSLSARDPRYLPVKEDRITLVGTRDLDEQESKLLASSAMRVVTRAQLKEANYQVPRMGSATEDLFIHLDADVLDISLGRANGFACPNGLLEQELRSIVEWAVASFNVCGLAITAFSPVHDTEGSIRQSLERTIISMVNALGVKEGRPAAR
jgi:arginase